MRVRLKGINSRTKRLADGSLKTYYWAWKGGPPLPGKPGDPEFIAAYNAAIAKKIEAPSGILLTGEPNASGKTAVTIPRGENIDLWIPFVMAGLKNE